MILWIIELPRINLLRLWHDLRLEVQYYPVRADPTLAETPSKQTRKNQKNSSRDGQEAKIVKKGCLSYCGKTCREGCWHFQIYWGWEAILKSWKCLISWGMLRKQLPRVPIDISFHFIGVGNGIDTFKFTGGERSCWNPEHVLSPKETLQSRAQWCPFDILSISLCLETGA